MKRVLAVGAISAITLTLLFAGDYHATATLSPLPEPDAELVALEVGTMLAITDYTQTMQPSQALQLAARAQAYNLIAERRGRDAADLLHLWQTMDAAGYAMPAVRGAQQIVVGAYSPPEIVRGMELAASPIIGGKYTHVGVGMAHVGDQWRTVIVAVYAPETVQTSGTSSEMGAYLPTVTR